MSPEFNLIQAFFNKPSQHTDLSIGDDAALFKVSANHQLAVSTDMLVAGTHFYPDTDPAQLGWKSLAVNLSDMAAMGATPKWATLSLALPSIDQDWLEAFSTGFFNCAKTYQVDLVGGDTTKGPLTLNITIMGEVPDNQALKRNGAKPEDDIWVSGELGNAALGLQHIQQKRTLQGHLLDSALSALHAPIPQCALGVALRNMANTCIDISDGLLADLSHILEASKVGATLFLEMIPTHPDISKQLNDIAIQSAVLAGGEDYELCFTADRSRRDEILHLSQSLQVPITRIGQITDTGLLNVWHDQQAITIQTKGYDHFT